VSFFFFPFYFIHSILPSNLSTNNFFFFLLKTFGTPQYDPVAPVDGSRGGGVGGSSIIFISLVFGPRSSVGNKIEAKVSIISRKGWSGLVFVCVCAVAVARKGGPRHKRDVKMAWSGQRRP
jgi:hypothetical protein